MPSYKFPCLYCTDTSRLRTSEHVLQRGFGGNRTLPDDVCTTCNTDVFSPLDKELISFAHSLVYWDHPHVTSRPAFTRIVGGHGLMLDEVNELWMSVRVDTHGQPILFQQFIFREDGTFAVVLDANRDAQWQQRLDDMREELSRPEQLSVERVILAGVGPPALQAAIVRSAPGKYFVRAADEAAAAKAETLLRSGAFGTGTTSGPAYGQQQATVQKTIAVDLGAAERALAKTALNFVCSVIGPEVARGPQFDELRAFALRSPYSAKRAGFVGWTYGDANPTATAAFKDMASRFTEQGKHSLVLADVDGMPMVVVILYERPFAVVRLTRVPTAGALPADTVVAGVFDYANRTHEILRLAEDPLAFAARFMFRSKRG